MPEALANVNGQLQPLADVRISPLDRGFLFGDAVYEVLRVYGGKPFLMAEHFQRLEHSLESIRIHGIDIAQLQERMHATIAAGPFVEALVYIQITRGAAPRTHGFPKSITPFEFLYVADFTDPYAEKRRTGVKVLLLPDMRWKRCDIKSTNLLANVLAAQLAHEAGAVEAILLQPDGTITEATRSSLFGVLNGKVLTAPETNAILPGITRSLILTLARQQGIPVEEHVMTKENLNNVSELFLTGTTAEVLPVVQVDELKIGTGRPGPVAIKLQEAYREFVHSV